MWGAARGRPRPWGAWAPRAARVPESREALGALGSGRAGGDPVRLRGELRGQVDVPGPVQQAADPAERGGGALGEPVGGPLGLGQHLVVVDDGGHDPVPERRVGIEHLVGEQDPARPRRPHQPWQRPGHAAVRGEPDPRVGGTDPRRAPGDRDVGGADDAHPGAGRPAADRGHARHRRVHQRLQEPVERLGQLVHVGVAVLGAGERAHVAAGAEVLALAHQQHRADAVRVGRVLVGQRAQPRPQLGEDLAVEGAVPTARDPCPQHPAVRDDGGGPGVGGHARARSFGRTSSANCARKRSWSSPGPWNTRWLSPASR